MSADHKHHREENMKMVREFEHAVGVMLSLEQIVVMLLLSKVVHVVVLAVIADLLEHDTHGVLKLPDHLHVFLTMVFMIGTHKFFLGQGTLKFGNPGSCFRR